MDDTLEPVHCLKKFTTEDVNGSPPHYGMEYPKYSVLFYYTRFMNRFVTVHLTSVISCDKK